MLARLRQIYDEADGAVAALSADPVTAGGVVCLGGRGCCKFDLFDHRLYLTVAELALLVTQPPAAPGRAGRWAAEHFFAEISRSISWSNCTSDCTAASPVYTKAVAPHTLTGISPAWLRNCLYINDLSRISRACPSGVLA